LNADLADPVVAACIAIFFVLEPCIVGSWTETTVAEFTENCWRYQRDQ
jgi:hypothetical protein